MQALLKLQKDYGCTELRDIPEPTPGPKEVKAEIKFSGICATDIKIFHNEHSYYKPPLVLGHEFSAVVVEVGQEVQKVKIGDRIVVAPLMPPTIMRGRHALERPWVKTRGFEAPWGFTTYGAFTKYGVYDEAACLKLPANIDLESAAVLEPMTVAGHGIMHLSMIHCTDVVVVSGPGSVGLLAMQIAKAEGAFVIMLGIDGDEKKLELAKELGADLTFNVSKEDPLQAILERTYNAGADVVIECSGTGASVTNLFNYARRYAQFIQIGTSMHKYEIDFMQTAYKELTVHGSFGYLYSDWEKSIRLLSMGKVKTKPVVSHEFPLSKWREAFGILEERGGVKILLYPDE